MKITYSSEDAYTVPYSPYGHVRTIFPMMGTTLTYKRLKDMANRATQMSVLLLVSLNLLKSLEVSGRTSDEHSHPTSPRQRPSPGVVPEQNGRRQPKPSFGKEASTNKPTHEGACTKCGTRKKQRVIAQNLSDQDFQPDFDVDHEHSGHCCDPDLFELERVLRGVVGRHKLCSKCGR